MIQAQTVQATLEASAPAQTPRVPPPETFPAVLPESIADTVSVPAKVVKAAPKAAVKLVRPGPVSISVPDDVEVYWNNRKIESKSNFEEKPGTYKIRLVKKGFKAIEQEVIVKSGEPTTINVSP
jgi:hypothetical protein